jgi:hypothetical protein
MRKLALKSHPPHTHLIGYLQTNLHIQTVILKRRAKLGKVILRDEK